MCYRNTLMYYTYTVDSLIWLILFKVICILISDERTGL